MGKLVQNCKFMQKRTSWDVEYTGIDWLGSWDLNGRMKFHFNNNKDVVGLDIGNVNGTDWYPTDILNPNYRAVLDLTGVYQ